jgi:RNA polymerase sigma-70 factor (sigma-E family)
VTFEELVAARGTAWWRLAYLLSGDRHLAEDLLQTALVQVYRRWRWVERADQPDAYVRRTIVNTMIDWRRRRSWWERPSVTGSLPETVSVRDGDVAEELASRDALWRLLGGLPPRARAVLVLRYYEDLDDAAIASLLGVSASSVRSTASRALAALRADLSTNGIGGLR